MGTAPESRGSLQHAKAIFDKWVQLPEDDRLSFLENECLGDSDLRQLVEELIIAFQNSDDIINFEVAAHPSSKGAEPWLLPANERFSIKRELGIGAFGAAYQVWDSKLRKMVALKQLSVPRAENIFRFKNEFRVLSELRHKNLVRLYELFLENGNWFFTMEFVDGLNFVDYFQAHGSRCDFNILRSVIRELVGGLAFLHSHHMVHRDLKPANVLVTRTQKPVILDFGLVRNLQADFHHQTFSMVGTPAYMSPEQIHRQQITAASDWYSLGLMIYQVLTGRIPALAFDNDGSAPAVTAGSLRPDVPEDLDILCCELLRTRPELRPDASKIRELLGISSTEPVKVDVSRKNRVFVGRRNQLDSLYSAFSDSQKGHLNVALVEGKSGIGKTSLVRQFTELVTISEPNLVVLRGRCREFESVPYKGVDSLIDDLAQFLQHAPDVKVRELLPRDAFLLPKLFPTLGKVKQIAMSPTRGETVVDEQELRQRIFTALRELLARLADRVPVLVWIDDLQWGDRDSSLLLADLCAPPSPPPLLLILSYRSEDIAFSPTLEYFQSTLATNTNIKTWHHISLSGLEDRESLELIRSISTSDLDQALESKIVSESAGHPFFIAELARLAGTCNLNHEWQRDLSLRSVLQERVAALPPVARELLELTCLATQPLSDDSLFAAGRLGGVTEQSDALQLLFDMNLMKGSRWRTDQRRAEPFHDQIRIAVCEIMGAALQRTRHSQLAQMLARDHGSEPQVLMTHLKESGDISAAYAAALEAARAAEDQLAFDRAAVFYETAIELGGPEEARHNDLYRRVADVLAKAGRGYDSAHAYSKAAETDGENAIVFRRLAIDQLMRTGYIDEALHAFQELAETVGIKTVNTPKRAIAGIVKGRVVVRARLLSGLPKASNHAGGPSLMRLELLRTGGVVLGCVDPVMATYYQIQYAREALKVRDPMHLAQALAMEASIRVATRMSSTESAAKILEHAEEIALKSQNANSIGFVRICRAYVDYLAGDVRAGIEHCEKAISFLRENCIGVAWELASAYVLLFWFKCWGGHVRDVRNLLPQLLKEGAARGDINVEVSLRLLSYVHYAYLSADEPDQCLAECDRAMARWSNAGVHLQHYGALFVRAETKLYQGLYSQARQLLLEAWPTLSRSFILRWQILRIMVLFLRGRIALACWLNNRRDHKLRAEVEHCAKRLKRIDSFWIDPMVSTLCAGLAAGTGRTRDAIGLLEKAQQGFERISLHAFASAAGNMANKLRAPEMKVSPKVEQFIRAEQIKNPEAFLRMLLPGNWL